MQLHEGFFSPQCASYVLLFRKNIDLRVYILLHQVLLAGHAVLINWQVFLLPGFSEGVSINLLLFIP